MAGQIFPRGVGDVVVEEPKIDKVSFSVKLDYFLAALRDDEPENWERGQHPPPLMYPTARVPEADVVAFASRYIEHLIREAHTAYYDDGGDGTTTDDLNRFADVTDDARAWFWRVQVVDVDATNDGDNDNDKFSSLPAWLRCSVPASNRWLGVRLKSPALWAEDVGSFRYLKHVLGALMRALNFHTPGGGEGSDGSMKVSIGMGKRPFSLREIYRFARGFFLTGPLLSTLQLRRSPPQDGGGLLSNSYDSQLGFEYRSRSFDDVDAKFRRETAYPWPEKLFEERRTIARGALPRSYPPRPLKYLGAASAELFQGGFAPVLAMINVTRDPLSGPFVYDFENLMLHNRRKRKNTIACRQLAATTDPDSVAVWCSLVTRLAELFLLNATMREEDWQPLVHAVMFAEYYPARFDVFDLLSVLGMADVAQSIQRRILEKADSLPWPSLPPPMPL